MEAVAADSVTGRHGQRLGDEREVVVERRVEAGDLGHAGERLAGQPDPRERRGLMERSEHTRGLDVSEHLVVDQ